MNNISSPRHDDSGIEQRIQSLGSSAPRVTPQDIENNILSTHYFTAAEGVMGEEMFNERPCTNAPDPLFLLTFCVIILKNGFTVTGESACVSPQTFNAEIGKSIARANAINKIWSLMGYALKQQLHNNKDDML
jgi:hypothetical protein